MDFAEFGKKEAKLILGKFEQCDDKLYMDTVAFSDNSSKRSAVFAEEHDSPYYDESGNDSVMRQSEFEDWGGSFVMLRVKGENSLQPSVAFSHSLDDQFEIPVLNLSKESCGKNNKISISTNATELRVIGHKMKITPNLNAFDRNVIESGNANEVLNINKSSEISNEHLDPRQPESLLKDEIISNKLAMDVWPAIVTRIEPLIRSIIEQLICYDQTFSYRFVEARKLQER